MWFATGKWTWLPFYSLIVALLVWKFKKQAIPMILLIALLITISDQMASGFFKPLVERFRPSHEESLKDLLYIVNDYRGGKYGFMSSHAANVFSLAFYLTFVASSRIRWLPYVLFPWAILVSLSRVYLGVHYPTDILVPAILSIPIALGVGYLYKICNEYLIKKLGDNYANE
ncbi:MAG: phosphatase PAP2 family protein [Pseudooceanicola sp.]|nr:phosphatase PAP2 family protein [Pseudooceanicola sp.]